MTSSVDGNRSVGTRNTTHNDANVCSRLHAKWCEALSVDEIVTSTSSSSLERESKSPVGALEEDGKLQFRLFDVISPVGDGMWNP
jgi:hypothetical protein